MTFSNLDIDNMKIVLKITEIRNRSSEKKKINYSK